MRKTATELLIELGMPSTPSLSGIPQLALETLLTETFIIAWQKLIPFESSKFIYFFPLYSIRQKQPSKSNDI